jgi:hypothetical protein
MFNRTSFGVQHELLSTGGSVMKRLNKSASAVFSLLLLGSAATNAAMISSGIGSTGWSLNYDNTLVTSFAFSPNAPGSTNQGSLSLGLLWTTSTPITLSFVENAPAAADAFGLRITLNENIINNSGVAFTGFGLTLNDPTTPSSASSNLHPGIAHFHNDSTNLGTFSVTGLPATLPPGGSSPTSFSATGSSLANAGISAWAGIGIHEWEVAGVARNFQLLETPVAASSGPVAVPEPGSYALLAAGLLGLGMTMRRRKT